VRGDELDDLVVLQPRGGEGELRILAIEKGLRRVRHHLHVDLGGVHIAKAPFEIVAAARERAIGMARDLQHAERGIDRAELEADRGRFLLQQRNRVVGQYMRVDIDDLHIGSF
jgi:hypothetical protein